MSPFVPGPRDPHRGRPGGPLLASPSPPRTCSTSPATRPAAATPIGRGRTPSRPATPGRCRRCSMPARRWSARRSPTRSRSASSARTPSTARRTTPPRRATCPAARPPARPARWRRGCATRRSAPTPAARCACRRASAASTASARRMAGSTSPACCRRRRVPTPPAGSRATPPPSRASPRCCCGEAIGPALPTRLIVATDAFGFAEPATAAALQPVLDSLKRLLPEWREEVLAPPGLSAWGRAQRTLQPVEAWNTFRPGSSATIRALPSPSRAAWCLARRRPRRSAAGPR